jgi:hypothetical protein
MHQKIQYNIQHDAGSSNIRGSPPDAILLDQKRLDQAEERLQELSGLYSFRHREHHKMEKFDKILKEFAGKTGLNHYCSSYYTVLDSWLEIITN